MYGKIQRHLQEKISEIQHAGLFKRERVIEGPQQADISVDNGTSVLNLCANNYLGIGETILPVVQAAQRRL